MNKNSSLRIMTYNIRHGKGIDGVQSLERIRDVIAEQSADIVALQEVDCRLTRSQGMDQAQWLGEQLGMESIFGRALLMENGSFGNAILSRYPIESHEFHPLPSADEPRGVLRAKIATPQGSCAFLCTHFGLSKEERLVQAGAILEIARREAGPTILMGDLNTRIESRTLKILLQPMGDFVSLCAPDILTFPTNNLNSWIDFILGTPGIRMVECRVPFTKASDHLPVVVDICL